MLSKIAFHSHLMIKAHARPMVIGAISRRKFATDNTDLMKTDSDIQKAQNLTQADQPTEYFE